MPSMTPEELLQIHKDYADQFASIAQSGLTAAFSALSNGGIFDYHPAGIGITFPDFGTPKPIGELPELPDDPKLPTSPTMLGFRDIPNNPFGGTNSSIGPGKPSGIENPPDYNAPTKPTNIHDFTAVAPTLGPDPRMPQDPTYIPLPALNLPFNTFLTPVKPSLSTPVFEGQRPEDIVLPDAGEIVTSYLTEIDNHRNALSAFATGQADAFIARYVPEYHQLRGRINNAILAYTDPVTGGGAGIPVNIEAAILARAADRNALESSRALSLMANGLTKKGWSMPGGALLDAMRQTAIGMGDAQVRSSTEVAVKGLEQEQQNFQFMFKVAETLESKMIDTVTEYLKLAVQIDAQAINAAKELVGAYIGAYNLQVMVYKALWDGYQADAEVLKARISANEANVRLYEAEIKAELAKVQTNDAYVGILKAVADVNQSIAMTYKAQIEAAMAPLEMAKLRLGIFETQARAYAAEVGAYEARWRGYTAEVEGELGKFKAYEAQVQGFIAQVTAFKAQIDSYVAQVQAAAETNKAIGLRNESTVKVYSAQAETAIKVFEGQIAGFTSQSNVVLKTGEIEVEFWRTKANLIFQEFNVAVNQMFEFAREQMNLFRGQMEAAINAGNGLAHASQVAGNLAGGAMQGLTSFAGILESKDS